MVMRDCFLSVTTWYSEMKSYLKLLIQALTAGSLLWSSSVWSDDVVVVMNRDNANTVDLAYVAKIYSGALKSWPDGSPVFALDQPEDSEIRANFSSQVLHRSVANMRAVWSQNIFTGKGLPPTGVKVKVNAPGPLSVVVSAKVSPSPLPEGSQPELA